MKSVLISIRPKWCELIAHREKTIEVRKTAPKEVPFKAYIYCTKAKRIGFDEFYADELEADLPFGECGNGKVIGEFLCDRIDCYTDEVTSASSTEDFCGWNDFDLNRACIHPDDIEKYANGNDIYGWHISNLVIYDKPKELADFWKPGRCPYNKNGCRYPYHCYRSGQIRRCGERLEKPPQSWCYVEEST